MIEKKKIYTSKTCPEKYKNTMNLPSNPERFLRLFQDKFFYALSLNANQKTQILLYLMRNMNRNNEISCTLDEIQNGCNIANRSTVTAAMKEFKEQQIIVMIHQSYYMFNPAIVMYGNNRHFAELYRVFCDCLQSNKHKRSEEKETNTVA